MKLPVSSMNSIKGMKGILVAATVAVAMLSASAYAGDPAATDPAAMVATLEKEAAEYRADAEKHERIAEMHRAGAGSSKANHDSVARHCKNIAKNLRAAAADSEALAAEYRKDIAK